MTAKRDFYAILGCGKGATDDELKKGYKKAAMKWHPDRHASKSDAERAEASEKFKAVAEAFEVLSDKNKRQIYDMYGEEGLKAGGGGGGGMPGGMGGMGGMPGMPGGMHFSFSTNGGGGMDAARAEKLFESFFGGSGGLGGMRMGGMRMGGMPSMFDDDNDPFAAMMGGGMMGGMPMGMMGGRGRKRPAPARPDTLPPGTVVRLVGLNNAELNDAVGRIETFDDEKQRYVVQVQPSEKKVAISPHNLRQIVTDAKIINTSQAALNGRSASAATYDAATRRYQCEGLKADGTVLALKPENVLLPTACRVTIDGVQSRKELNGMVGMVNGVESERYVVQLNSGESVKLKFDAVYAC